MYILLEPRERVRLGDEQYARGQWHPVDEEFFGEPVEPNDPPIRRQYMAFDEIKSVKDTQHSFARQKNAPQYMVGLYNGIELCDATLEAREPKFLNIPKRPWIKRIFS